MKINTNRSLGSYSVHTFNKKLDEYFKKEMNIVTRKAFIIIDSNVHKYHWVYLKKALRKNFILIDICKFNAIEKNKSFQQVQIILSRMLKRNCDRNTILISIGGGITGDISSFAASIFMRGIEYIHVPTTLLSMVDSSIGGKTGINFNYGKNLIGTFHQPKAVFIDTSFLSTLPEREIHSGMGEIIKYYFLSGRRNKSLDRSGIGRILSKDYKSIEKIIYECIKIKISVVEKDEREEKGLRKILNLGHTFAHGIESASNYKINHGEAVVMGIICSLFYSYRTKLISAEHLYSSLLIFKPVLFFLIKVIKHIKPEKVITNMNKDKKNKENTIRLVLLNNSDEIIIDYPAKRNLIFYSIDDMKVWVTQSFKKETVEK